MNCVGVRDRLSEHALGVVRGRDADAVERHLEWCAACRKEARDLRRAAGVLPYALAPAEPPADLEDRVVDAVAEARGVGRPDTAASRRSRLATVAVLAAVMAVSGLGWGAVMAGRASRAEENAAVVAQQTQQVISNFADVLSGSTVLADADVELALLTPTEAGGDAGGTAATIVVPQAKDQVLLLVNGLSADEGAAPYTVQLRAGQNETLVMGTIRPSAIASDGSADFAVQTDDDLRRMDRVRLVDAAGQIVLRGALAAQASVPSPTPSP